MKRKRDLFLCLTCLLLAILLTFAGEQKNGEAMAARIAPQILRFHVLANSNSHKDQQLKLAVRTELLNAIYKGLGENASLEDTKEYVIANRTRLEKAAEDYMKKQGYDYSAHMELTNCYFPTKAYGDMVFPCGTYDAVRVELGKGKGHNWWCVLYPPLCFVDSTYAVVPDSSKEVLKHSLNPADYQALLKKKPELHVKVRFKLLDLLKKTDQKQPSKTLKPTLSTTDQA